MRSAIELFLRAMIGDLQISNSDDWDLDWDLDIFDVMIEGVILISFFPGVVNSNAQGLTPHYHWEEMNKFLGGGTKRHPKQVLCAKTSSWQMLMWGSI